MSRIEISKEMVKQAILIRAFFTDRNYESSGTFVSFLLHGNPKPIPEKIMSDPKGFAGLVDNFHRFVQLELDAEKKEISEFVRINELKKDELEKVEKYLNTVSESLRKIVTIFYKESKGTTAVERDIKRELNDLTSNEEKISKISPKLYQTMKPIFGNIIIALRSPEKKQVMNVCGNASKSFSIISSNINRYFDDLKTNLKTENKEISLINNTEKIENKLIVHLYKIVGVIPKSASINKEKLMSAIEENFAIIVSNIDMFIKNNYVFAKLVESEIEETLRVA